MDHRRHQREEHRRPAGQPGHRHREAAHDGHGDPDHGEGHEPVVEMLGDGVPDRVQRTRGDHGHDDQRGQMRLRGHAVRTRAARTRVASGRVASGRPARARPARARPAGGRAARARVVADRSVAWKICPRTDGSLCLSRISGHADKSPRGF